MSMMIEPAEREDLNVPDRFEMLRSSGAGTLRSLVVPVHEALVELDSRFRDLRAAGRGGLSVMRGQPGAGKSTFLDTLHLFREGVETLRITQDQDIAKALTGLDAPE
ncbi:MAG: hypothetical protein J7503_15185, partial [Cellulomonas iranensis]|uniref:hypothetical protein n=1 Tax=Cellulomonas iranensis TaxID=76862 RepID=UPI001B1DC8A8